MKCIDLKVASFLGPKIIDQSGDKGPVIQGSHHWWIIV